TGDAASLAMEISGGGGGGDSIARPSSVFAGGIGLFKVTCSSRDESCLAVWFSQATNVNTPVTASANAKAFRCLRPYFIFNPLLMKRPWNAERRFGRAKGGIAADRRRHEKQNGRACARPFSRSRRPI